MTNRTWNCVLTAVFLAGVLAAAPVAAQVTPARAPLKTDGCVVYDGSRPAQLHATFVPAADELQMCITALKNLVVGMQVPDSPQVHDDLLSAYLTYVNLKTWHDHIQSGGKARTANPPSPSVDDALLAGLRQSFAEMATVVHDGLAAHGLLQPFAANVVSGFVFATTGAQTASSDPSSNGTDTGTAQATGYVHWESLHFWTDPDHRWIPDFSISGNDGFLPSLVLIVPTDPKIKGPLATYQQSFVWSARASANFRTGDRAEIAAFGTFGQTILTSLNTLLGDSASTTVATPVANNTGRAEGFGEIGSGLRLFSESVDIVHVSRGLFAPTLLADVGLRWDNRFKGEGALAQGFDSPNERFFFRFVLDAIRILNKAGADGGALTFGFEVDYQRALHSATLTVPVGNRVLIRGDLNLFKSLQGSK